MFLLATAVGNFASGMLGLVIFLGFVAAIVASAIWFFRGPATAGEKYVDALAMQLQNPQDAALFRNVYKTKNPRSTTVAWVLTTFLSPTIGYLYQGKWALAAVSFVTFQGFLIWWVVAIFTTPMEVVAKNKRLADEAFNQVMIGRGGGMGYGQGQVINVNQYAYMPHPQPGNQPTIAATAQMPTDPPPMAHSPVVATSSTAPAASVAYVVPQAHELLQAAPQPPARID